MGTRSLTIVKLDNKIKVRQYCQWDGYPTGVGTDIANFIQNEMDLAKLKASVKKLTFFTLDEIEEKYYSILKHNDDLVTLSESKKIEKKFPEAHRNTGPKILKMIQDKVVTKMMDGGPFTRDSWCEYAYEINLDKKTVTVYYGFSKSDKKKYTFKQFTSEAMSELENMLKKRWDEQ